MVQPPTPGGGRWGAWQGVRDASGRVDVGGDWARWGEGQRCVGRGSEPGCGSSEGTGACVQRRRRPVGREGNGGRNSLRGIPLPSGARGPRVRDHFCPFPVFVPNWERALLDRVGRTSQEFPGLPVGRRHGPSSPLAFRFLTPTSSRRSRRQD